MPEDICPLPWLHTWTGRGSLGKPGKTGRSAGLLRPWGSITQLSSESFWGTRSGQGELLLKGLEEPQLLPFSGLFIPQKAELCMGQSSLTSYLATLTAHTGEGQPRDT